MIMIDSFLKQINPSWVNSCQEVRELYWLNVHIYIFVWLFLKYFLHTVLLNTNNFLTDLFDS